MRVLLQGMKLHEGKNRQPAGNFRHVEQLAKALSSYRDVHLHVLTDCLTLPELRKVVPMESLIETQIRNPGIVQVDAATLRAIRRLRPDIYHRPTGQMPFGRIHCKTVAGVADLNFRALKTPLLKRLYKEASYRWTMFSADKIICVSHYTCKEVKKNFKVAENKLRVVHHGVTQFPEVDFTASRKCEEPMWLCFAHQNYKNAEVCIRAMSLLQGRPGRRTLAVVGEGSYVDEVLRPLAGQLNLPSVVRFIGRVTSSELAGLYQSAIGLIFMSRYEGFGLPVLESMGHGCPVICSNACSLPEVAGDAAVMLHESDVMGLVQAMEKLENDEPYRRNCVARGRERASQFTWSRAADKTVEIYREVLNQQGASPKER